MWLNSRVANRPLNTSDRSLSNPQLLVRDDLPSLRHFDALLVVVAQQPLERCRSSPGNFCKQRLFMHTVATGFVVVKKTPIRRRVMCSTPRSERRPAAATVAPPSVGLSRHASFESILCVASQERERLVREEQSASAQGHDT